MAIIDTKRQAWRQHHLASEHWENLRHELDELSILSRQQPISGTNATNFLTLEQALHQGVIRLQSSLGTIESELDRVRERALGFPPDTAKGRSLEQQVVNFFPAAETVLTDAVQGLRELSLVFDELAFRQQLSPRVLEILGDVKQMVEALPSDVSQLR